MADCIPLEHIGILQWNGTIGHITLQDRPDDLTWSKAWRAAIAGPLQASTGLLITHQGEHLIGPSPHQNAKSATFSADRHTLHATLRELERGPRPVAIVVQGSALNEAADFLLLAHHVIAAASDTARVGWPALAQNAMPALGATARLPRRIGLRAALTQLLDPQTFSFDHAVTLGLIHHVATDIGQAILDAIVWLRQHPTVPDPFDPKHGAPMPGPASVSPAGQSMLLVASAQVVRHYRVGHAAEQVLVAVSEGTRVTLDAALQIETRCNLSVKH